jgi:hypothetical protein
MTTRIATVALVCGVAWLSQISTSSAQVARPFDSPSRGKYAPVESRQTVSPYVNLTNGGNGLSNYQTLVRPLIEEREELNRQWAALDDLNRRVRGGPIPGGPGARGGANGRNASGVRYMHSSHYFGTTR